MSDYPIEALDAAIAAIDAHPALKLHASVAAIAVAIDAAAPILAEQPAAELERLRAEVASLTAERDAQAITRGVAVEASRRLRDEMAKASERGDRAVALVEELLSESLWNRFGRPGYLGRRTGWVPEVRLHVWRARLAELRSAAEEVRGDG